MTAGRFAGLVGPVVADERLVARVLAARAFVGDEYLQAVRERAKARRQQVAARRRWQSLTLYERVLESRGNP